MEEKRGAKHGRRALRTGPFPVEPGKRLMRQVAAWVTPDEHALINRLADENGCSVSTLLRGALIHHFGFTPVEDRPERRGDV